MNKKAHRPQHNKPHTPARVCSTLIERGDKTPGSCAAPFWAVGEMTRKSLRYDGAAYTTTYYLKEFGTHEWIRCLGNSSHPRPSRCGTYLRCWLPAKEMEGKLIGSQGRSTAQGNKTHRQRRHSSRIHRSVLVSAVAAQAIAGRYNAAIPDGCLPDSFLDVLVASTVYSAHQRPHQRAYPQAKTSTPSSPLAQRISTVQPSRVQPPTQWINRLTIAHAAPSTKKLSALTMDDLWSACPFHRRLYGQRFQAVDVLKLQLQTMTTRQVNDPRSLLDGRIRLTALKLTNSTLRAANAITELSLSQSDTCADRFDLVHARDSSNAALTSQQECCLSLASSRATVCS